MGLRFSIGILTVLLVMLQGCAVYYGGDRYALPRSEAAPSSTLLLSASAAGSAQQKALMRAERELLVKASMNMLDGTSEEQSLRDLIQEVERPAYYLVPDSIRILDWDLEDGMYHVTLEALVDLDALLGLLTARGAAILDQKPIEAR